MIYIACTVANNTATVLSVHTLGHNARAAADRAASKPHEGELRALEVRGAHAAARRKPRRGDTLTAYTDTDGDLVALAPEAP